MQDNTIPQLIARNKYKIIVTAVAAALLSLVLSLLMPKQYLSEASLLPANSKMMDKQAIFGNNIQELYSAYGAEEDLDRLLATLHSATVLQFVADSLRLSTHYGIQGKDEKGKAVRKLHKQMKLLRTEYGEVNVKIWDKDPVMAKQIADLILWRTQQVYDELFTSYYERSIKRLDDEILKFDGDSIRLSASNEKQFLMDRRSEYRITALNPPAAMFILAKPDVAVEADKPDVILNVVIAAVIGFFTAITWIVGMSSWKSAYAKP